MTEGHMGEEALWQMEADFWTGDARFYEANLADGAMMVFPPPAGVLDRARIIATIREAQRWREVEMTERQTGKPTPDTVVIAYRASARREGDDAPYRAVCGSVYTRVEGAWKLVLHQQSPVPGD